MTHDGRDQHDGAQTVVQIEPRAPASSQRPCPELTWTDASGAHRVSLAGRRVAGSAPSVDLVVSDAAVSRLHADFEPRDDGVWVRDLGSRNGTYIEGVRISGGRVPEGGRVRVGSTTLVLRYNAASTTVDVWPDESFGPMVGRSAVMREMFAQIARVAATDSTVLLQGETGTGKELVAHALHAASPRAGGPFVVVDCSALPENLLESELFGHAKGAFTGATSARAGALESAERGTVFLDEVGELPLAMQPKLLRAVESRTVRRVGETAYRPIDVRFVSATHRDLCHMVNAGAFREDLYFRLAVLPLVVPPLRDRLDDIALLVEHFQPRGTAGAIDPAFARELSARPWFGNVRELRNFVERAAAFGVQRALAMPTHAHHALETLPAPPLDQPFKDIRERWLDHLEREYIRGLLAQHQGNVSAVADAAGLARTYVHRLIRKHEL